MTSKKKTVKKPAPKKPVPEKQATPSKAPLPLTAKFNPMLTLILERVFMPTLMELVDKGVESIEDLMALLPTEGMTLAEVNKILDEHGLYLSTCVVLRDTETDEIYSHRAASSAPVGTSTSLMLPEEEAEMRKELGLDEVDPEDMRFIEGLISGAPAAPAGAGVQPPQPPAQASPPLVDLEAHFPPNQIPGGIPLSDRLTRTVP